MNDIQYIEEIEVLAKIASWKVSFTSGSIDFSKSINKIFELPEDFRLRYASFLKIIIDDDREFVHAIFKDLKDVYSFPQFYFTIKFGAVQRHLFIKGSLIRSESGLVLGARGIVQDITDIKSSLTQLHSQNKKLDHILWMQSHVLRSPVATILGLVKLLEIEGDLNDNQLQIISGLSQAATQLDDIIRDLNDKGKD